MDKKEIDNKIKSLKNEIELLEAERGTSGIKPSQTKELIEKWYGHCFSFEGYESGSLDIMLDTIRIDRKNKTISIGGHFIIYVTPDISFIHFSENLCPMGGTLICDGCIDINTIPYVEIDWEESDIYTELNNLLKGHEISSEEFKKSIREADEYCDNSDYVISLEKVYEDYENGWDFDYNQIFGAL